MKKRKMSKQKQIAFSIKYLPFILIQAFEIKRSECDTTKRFGFSNFNNNFFLSKRIPIFIIKFDHRTA